jgi:hypothetical protein
MAGAFLAGSSDEESEEPGFSGSEPLKRAPAKTPEWAEDFNAKEMAKGLQTLLSKDKEG